MIWLIGCIIAKLYHGPDIASMSWSLSGSMFWTIGSLRLIFFGISVYTTLKPEAPLSSETMCSGLNSYLIKCNQYDVYSTKQNTLGFFAVQILSPHVKVKVSKILIRGCSHITSAKTWTPPPPSVSNSQHLAYPPSPLVSNAQCVHCPVR